MLMGVNQTAGQLQLARADELGVDLVQTSAHIGARNKGVGPVNHEGWQGRIFSISGKHPKYPNFEEETGFGTVVGLMGVNCRHSYFPYFEGISQNAYSEAEVNEYASKRVTYQGEEISVYEATQKQRGIEREIRKAKREADALKAAGLDNSGELQRVRIYQAKMREFTRETGLSRQRAREQIFKADPAEAFDRETKLAKEGKLFNLNIDQENVIYDKAIDYKSIYNSENFSAENVLLMPNAKGYIIREHEQDALWAVQNQNIVLKAITEPLYIDRIPRKKGKTSYNIAHIVETGDFTLPYLNVVINFREGKDSAIIFNLFRTGKEYIFTQTGDAKVRWLKLN